MNVNMFSEFIGRNSGYFSTIHVISIVIAVILGLLKILELLFTAAREGSIFDFLIILIISSILTAMLTLLYYLVIYAIIFSISAVPYFVIKWMRGFVLKFPSLNKPIKPSAFLKTLVGIFLVVVIIAVLSSTNKSQHEPVRYYPSAYERSSSYEEYGCTDDCSGHNAGWEWAESHGITDPDECGGNSESFIEGCRAYAVDH